MTRVLHLAERGLIGVAFASLIAGSIMVVLLVLAVNDVALVEWIP
jgi:uncharacterized RDD family membrane protein YckC